MNIDNIIDNLMEIVDIFYGNNEITLGITFLKTL